MSSERRRMRGVLILMAGIGILVAGCGDGGSLDEELRQVPGLCFLHVHIGAEFDTSILPDEVSAILPLWLCDSLLAEGPLGVSLIGVNLTDLTPQLLFLTRTLEPGELAAMASSGFDCGVRAGDDRFDLVTPGGSLIGSTGGRGEWSCLVTGAGADGAVDRWLALEEEASLAADTGLAAVSRADCDVTILVSRNTISFLSFIPDGMLTRSERALLDSVKALIQDLGPEALRIGLGISSTDPVDVYVEFELLRAGGAVSVVRLGVSDSGLSLDSLVTAAAGFLGS